MESCFEKLGPLFTQSCSGFCTASVIVILPLVAAMVLYANLRQQTGRSLRLPPGPFSWPFIGSLHLLGSLPHQSLSGLSKKYGPLMYLTLGSVPAVVASSPALAQEFLKSHDEIFASRARRAQARILGYGGAGIGWAPYGSHLRRVRALCRAELFAPKSLEFFRQIREEEIFSVLQSVWRDSQSDKDIDVAGTFSSLASNNICRMVFSKKYMDAGGQVSAKASNFKKLTDEFFLLDGVFNIGDYIPLLKPFDLQSYERRMVDVMKTLDGFIEEIIEQRRRQRQARKTREDKDFLDVMLSRMESRADLSLLNVKAVMLDLLVAGTDTVAGSSEWAFVELLRHPASLQKVQDELDREVGRERKVRESDLDRLTYLQAVVKETFRLHPPAPLLPRQSMEACKVNGYDIPANTTLLVNLWAIGRDPDVWNKAWEFYPERFVGDKRTTDFRGHHFELIPFGSGRRMCPGLPLAHVMLHLGLAALIQGFEWKLPQGDQQVDMREVFGLTLHRAVGLRAEATPRLPCHLYTNPFSHH